MFEAMGKQAQPGAHEGLRALAAVKPNVVTFGAAIRFVGQAGDTAQALRLLTALENEPALAPDAVAYAAAINACRASANPRATRDEAEGIFARAERRDLADVVVFNALLGLLDALGDADAALALLRRAPSPNAISFAHAASACKRAGRWRDALVVLDDARKARCANTRVCNAALAALERAGRWEEAINVLKAMAPDGDGAPPDAASLRLVLFACLSAQPGPPRVREALTLFLRAERGDLLPHIARDAVSYRVLVRACDVAAGGAIPALQLLCAAEADLPPDAPLAPIEDHHEAFVARAVSKGAVGGPTRDVSSEAFRVIYREKGSERMPRNHQDLELFYAADTAPLFAGVPPPVAAVRRIDVPGVPGAFVLTDVMSATECAQMVRCAEALRFRPDEPVRTKAADTSDVDAAAEAGPYQTGIDNVEWLLDEHLHDRIFSRVAAQLPALGAGAAKAATGINRRLRLFRYGTGGVYRPHLDGSWPACAVTDEGRYRRDAFSGAQRSRLTFLLYLEDECAGGYTTFYVPRRTDAGVTEAIEKRRVEPLRGCVLCFPHGDDRTSAWHEGSAVVTGRKVVARTDVLYSSVQ